MERCLPAGATTTTFVCGMSRTGEGLQILEGHGDSVTTVVFSPDGLTLASGSNDDTIRLWDVRTDEHLQTLEGHTNNVLSLAYSPDGFTLASGSWDNTIRLWDARSGEDLHILKGHGGGVNSVAISPDGITLASGSSDTTIRLWDSRTGEHLKTFEGHALEVRTVAFSPDGLTLASVSLDLTILLWEIKRVTTWGGIKEDGVPEMTRESSEASPSAAPLSSTETALLPNYPNPFNPETWIPYQLSMDAEVVLTIYDTKGQAVRTLSLGHQSAGVYQSRERAAYWDGHNQQGETVASGIYFYTLTAGDFTATHKNVSREVGFSVSLGAALYNLVITTKNDT